MSCPSSSILLASGGNRTPERKARLAEELKRHFGSAKKLLFIGYAKKDQASYCKSMSDMCGGYELESIDEKKDQCGAILAAEGIFVGGGNSFVLASELHKRG